MRTDRFRFNPPLSRLSPECEWTLSRAFGPAPRRPIRLWRPELVLDWATALGLCERIACRSLAEHLQRELPTHVAASLERSKEALAGRTLLLQRLLDRVAETAHAIGVSVIALKGIALLETGVAACGGRPLLDLDLLVDGDRAADLAEALERQGMVPNGGAEAHHLPPLADPRLGEVELHLFVPGVGIEGRGPATAARLRDAGLVRASPRLPGLELPAPELLVAHAIAHGLDQHGLSPTAYPITRLIADLVEFESVDPLAPEIRRRLTGAASLRELEALTALGRTLASDRLPTAGSDADALLRHTLTAISSPDYRRNLRRRAALRALRRGQWWKFRSELRRRAGGHRALGS